MASPKLRTERDGESIQTNSTELSIEQDIDATDGLGKGNIPSGKISFFWITLLFCIPCMSMSISNDPINL